METKNIEITKLHPNTGQVEGLPTNPRQIKKERFKALKKSIEDAPEMLSLRELIVYPHNGRFVVIGGNMRLRACKELGFTVLPCKVLDEDTPVAKLREYAIKDNNEFGEDDWDILANEWDAEELNDWGMPTPDGWIVSNEPAKDDVEESDEEPVGDEVPDILFPSDNDMEVPTLLIDNHAGNLVLPVMPWGANPRGHTKASTLLLYVEDYRFSRLWKKPNDILNADPVAVVEPNFSLHDLTPIAYGLQLIYKKRWLARYWQEFGIKIYVDLFVAPKFQEYNKLGVPQGFNAFATRGESYIDGRMEADLDIARQISGKDTPNMICYGGGEKIKEKCQRYGLTYIENFMTTRKGEINNG